MQYVKLICSTIESCRQHLRTHIVGDTLFVMMLKFFISVTPNLKIVDRYLPKVTKAG